MPDSYEWIFHKIAINNPTTWQEFADAAQLARAEFAADADMAAKVALHATTSPFPSIISLPVQGISDFAEMVGRSPEDEFKLQIDCKEQANFIYLGARAMEFEERRRRFDSEEELTDRMVEAVVTGTIVEFFKNAARELSSAHALLQKRDEQAAPFNEEVQSQTVEALVVALRIINRRFAEELEENSYPGIETIFKIVQMENGVLQEPVRQLLRSIYTQAAVPK